MKEKLLLHTCCAPCSGFLVSELEKKFAVFIYYNNSNIYPETEFVRRQTEAQNFFITRGTKFFLAPYDHKLWRQQVVGLESEPERGKRCRRCYEIRLRQTAEFARQYGFPYFASTLAISPHKDAAAINELGGAIASEQGINFLAGDWKKQDGFKKAMAFSRAQGFYQQDYCGCEFSRPDKINIDVEEKLG